VPSKTLNAVNGDSWPDTAAAYRYLHVRDNRVTVHARPEAAPLTSGNGPRWMRFSGSTGTRTSGIS
jgi:hypothetical protein